MSSGCVETQQTKTDLGFASAVRVKAFRNNPAVALNYNPAPPFPTAATFPCCPAGALQDRLNEAGAYIRLPHGAA